VLVEFQDGPRRDVSRMIVQRVSAVLCERLSSNVAHRLQVRAREERFGLPPSAVAELIPGEI
jgi:hypothetical protein